MQLRSRQGIGRRAVRVLAGGLTVGGLVAGVGVAGAAQQADTTVSVLDNRYEAPAVSISTGDTVTWDYQGVSVHNVKGEAGPDPAWLALNTQLKSTGTDTFTFTQPGDYAYLCIAHATVMTGTIAVAGPPVEPTPTPNPTPPPTQTPVPPPPAAAPSPPGGAPAPTKPSDQITTPAPGAGARDDSAPTVSDLRIAPIRHGARVALRLSETASVTVRIKRRGSGKVVRTARLQLRGGARTITVRGNRLKRGRYTVELEARDGGGNRSPVQRAALRIKRVRG